MKLLLLLLIALQALYVNGQGGYPRLIGENKYSYSGSVGTRAATTYIQGIQAWNYDTCYTYDVISGSMNAIKQTAHKLDQQGNILERTFISYSTPSNYERHYYTYDASNRIASWRVSYWNDIAQQQEDYSRTSYIYDATGVLTEELFETYGGGWALNLRTRYIYTGGYNTQKITESWDRITQTWHHVDEVKQTFDASGRKLSMEWVDVTREYYTYDANGKLQTCAVEGKQGNLYKKSHLLEYTYNNVAGVTVVASVARKKWNAPGNNYEFQHGDDSVHYYYDITSTHVSKAIAHNLNLHVYPLPASDVIQLSTDATAGAYTIALYDASGKLVKRNAGIVGVDMQLNVADVPPGNYMLQFYSTSGRANRQVVIAR
jgi:hypothetical protein